MSLTDEQKKAGRVFRDSCQAELDALNAARPPGGDADPLLRVVRHPCEARGGASTGIALRQHYQASGEYKVCQCGVIAKVTAPEGDFPHWDCGANKVAAADGLLCFIWKDGRCPECQLVLRSALGIIDLAARRPPERT